MAKNTSLDTFRTLYNTLRKRESIKSVYYLYGDESFLIDMLQDEIEKLIPDDQKDFNFDLIYGNESTPAKVLNIASSYPMMAEKRIVIVRDFLKLDENADGEGIKEFTGYFENPNPTTILCLIDTKFPHRGREPGKTLTKKNKETNQYAIHEFEKIDERNLPDWIIDWTRHSHKRQINPEAAQVLAQLVGPNLKLLSSEIDKLCTFVDTSKAVEVEHVKKITQSYRDYSVIELKNAIIERNLSKSLQIAEQMLLKSNNNTGEIIKTVGFFYSVFSNIWQISRLTEKGLTKQQVQDTLNIRSNYIFNIQYQEASNFRLAEMPNIFEALLDADSAAKGFSTLDTPSIFLLLIKRIIG
ncbi:MAG: DNA polymerase III subunit delta [Balneolaceae bacterium]|nr:DNA polymerase III subunit delta [Balneolaceae bacterium]